MFLYTSGSTGRPKGVVLSHYSHLWAISQRVRRPVPQGQRSLVAAPLYHMNGLAMCQTTLSQGDTIVLLPQFTTRGYIEAAARHRVAFLTSVPTMIAMMLREKELLASNDLSAVEAVRMGSAPITQALIDQVRAAFPKAAISNGYGTTEAGPVVFGPHPEGIPQPELSTGYPHPEVAAAPGARRHARSQDEGVLEMKCGALMTHYHKLPEVTAKAMTPDGYYRTGDVFRRDENGFFFFVGRADDMFVCGGENIYPGEVEKMLERHPGIHQAAVIPIPDELKGHKPIAFVVRANGADARRAGGQELRARQRAGLPASAPASSSSTRCRLPAPTRSTSACSPSRSQPEENPKNESRRRPRAWRARPPELRDRLPRSHARRGRRDRGGQGLVAELPRRLHPPRHARHQGADAGHHGPRRRGRDRRGRAGRHAAGRRATACWSIPSTASRAA